MKEKKNSNMPYSLIAFLMSGVMLGMLIVNQNILFLIPLIVCLLLGIVILIWDCYFRMELFKEDSFLRDARKIYSRLEKGKIKKNMSILSTPDGYKLFRSEIRVLLKERGVSTVDEDTIVKILIKKFSTQESIFTGTTSPTFANFIIIFYSFLTCGINILFPSGWISMLRPEVITTISPTEIALCVLLIFPLILFDYILVEFLIPYEKEKYNSLQDIIKEIPRNEEYDETVDYVRDLEDSLL